jgi:RND family efflux transporter MFP subunit
MTSTHQLLQQSGYKKYLVWLIPFIALIALILLMKASGSGQTQQAPAITKNHLVNVMSIEWLEQYSQKRLVKGRVEASQTAAIGFDLAGSVVKILVDEGQSVKEGQVLAELDTQRLDAQMVELSAILNRAKSEANLAKLSLKRVVELVERKLESPQRLDEATESVNAANAFSDEILARKQRLQVEMNKTKVRAPFDGSVVSRFVDKGTVVAAGQTLFKLQQNGQLEGRFALSTDYATNLNIGQVVTLSSQSTQVQGKVKSIAQQRSLDTRTVDVIIRLSTKDTSILPGDLLHLDFNSEINAKGFWVPQKALVSGVRGLWSLFAVETIDGELQLVAKLVEMVHADHDKAYVRGALQNAELVVSDGVQRLVPGQKVEVVDGSLTNAVTGLL